MTPTTSATTSASSATSALRLAHTIEADVVARGWPVGASLGSELELMAAYGAGRRTVREAVRLLEMRRVVTTREGRGGGVHVVSPDLDGVLAATRVYLRHATTTADHVREVWSALLVQAAGDAARRVTPAEARRWRQADAASEPPAALHAQIATLSRNPATELLLLLLSGLWVPAPSHPTALVRDHRDLVSLITCGNAPSAEAAAVATAGHLVFDPAPQPDDAGSQRKSGERTAEALVRGIEESGWPVGAHLGTQADLQRRFGVSRATVREAVRLAEGWSVVESRRGRGGGIVVTAPNPVSLRDSARAWLRYAGTSRAALFAVREPLEVLSVRRVASDPPADLASVLDDVLASERAAGPAFVTGGPNPLRVSLSVELARRSGNPILALFVPTVIDLCRTFGMPGPVPDAGVRWVSAQHRGIADAVASGDVVLAELLVRRYVAAVAGMDRPGRGGGRGAAVANG